MSKETTTLRVSDCPAAKQWDYIVVGAGSAGCVLASRLTEDPRTHVLLVEAGGSDRSPIILAPAATDIYAIGCPAWDWCYNTEPDASRSNRVDLYSRGKVLGGSSSINGTIYVRGSRHDFDGWAENGAHGWSFDDVLPYFRKAERNDLGDSAFHGSDGPLSVQRLRYVHPLTQTFIEAAVESGLPLNLDINGATQDGVGPIQATQQRGWRHNTARAYLRPAQRRSNLSILTGAHVERLLFAGSQTIGVQYRHRGVTHKVLASKEIILAAGAIGSPHILLLSGIGPSADLKSHGIAVVSDIPAVGNNLQEHPGAWLTYRMRTETLNNEASAAKKLVHGLNWLLFGRGPATTPGAQAVAFLRTSSSLASPDIQIHFTPVGYKILPTRIELAREPTVSVLSNVCKPRSRGRVSLKSANPHVAPRINIALLSDPEDVRVLVAGCRIARGIMNRAPIARLVEKETAPGDTVATDDGWTAFLRDATICCYHPVGTCRMGSDSASVVDPQLRVRGIRGLRVADASIMPTIPSANTNAASIMIGEKASDLIRGSRKDAD